MKNVVAAFNSSIQFNKKNFWIDPVGGNQYFVGVQYPEGDIKSIETLLNIPITGPDQKKAIPLGNLITLRRTTVPTEVTHTNIQPTIDLTMGVYGRDLGHVSDDVTKAIDDGRRASSPTGPGIPYDPASSPATAAEGVEDRAQRRVRPDAGHVPQPGLRPDRRLGADLLPDGRARQVVDRPPDRSCSSCRSAWSASCRCSTSPGTAVNVQSLLGFIFIVGIKVSNTVLMTDFAQELRSRRG